MNMFARLRAAWLLLCLGASLLAQTPAQKNRIAADADMKPTTRLSGHLPPWVNAQADLGAAPDATPVRLSILLSRAPEREAAFGQLVADQQNPSSPVYHRWLTPSEIGEQYGPSLEDIHAVTRWLMAQGLTVVSVSPSRISIEVEGTAGMAGTALSTSFHRYAVDETTRFAAATEPAVPSALAVAITAIRGLAEVPLRPSSEARPMYSGLNNTVHYTFPGDFAKIYDVPVTAGGVYVGTGVKVAIIARSQITTSDVTLLETMVGLPAKAQNVILVPGSADPGLVKGDEDESTLDVQRVLTTAPGAQADLVIAASTSTSDGITTAIQYNVNTLVDPVMTISYGACEALVGRSNILYFDSLFQTAAAEGISTFVSSGDSAAAGCSAAGAAPTGRETLGINYLCASSYVTCVGGTQFNDTAAPANYWSAANDATRTSALGYIPEGGWNEPSFQTTTSGVTTTAYQISGTGGGPSLVIAKPTWQTGAGVPSDGVRDTPDISFTSSSHDPYFGCLAYKGSGYDCSKGGGTLFYGTSAAAPSMAAIVAILNQRAGKPQGNLNPLLYSLAASTPTAFHDATPASSGVSSCSVNTASSCNNSLPNANSLNGVAGYPLQVGYDQVTGLGSLDVANFLNAATGVLLVTPTLTVTASPTTITTRQTVTFTASFTGTGTVSPTGTIQFYNGNATLLSPVTVSGGAAASQALTFPTAGTYQIKAVYSGDANYASVISTVINFIVTDARNASTTTVTAPATTFLVSQTNTYTASVTSSVAGTPTGTVQFFDNGNAFTAVPLSSGKAVTAPQNFLRGSHVVTAAYSGDANYAASNGTLNVTATGIPTTTTAGSSATTFGSLTPTTFTANIQFAASPGYSPAGTVQFLVDGAVSGASVAVTGTTSGVATSAPMTLSAGTHSVVAVYNGDSYFNGSTSAAFGITVAAQGIGIAPSPSTLSLAAGATTGNTTTITLTSLGSYAASVALRCTVSYNGGSAILPPTCSLSTSPVAVAAGGTATSVLTLSTTLPHSRQPETVAYLLGGLLLLLIPAARRGRLRTALCTLIVILGLGVFSGCGQTGVNVTPTPTTPVGTSTGAYTVLVTATATGISTSTTVALTVH